MYLKDCVVKRPPGTKLCPSGKGVYVYHVVESTYHPDRKYNLDRRVCVGKMVEGSDDQMIPNDRFGEFYPEWLSSSEGLPLPGEFSDTLSAGAVTVIREISREMGLPDILRKVYGEKMGEEILSLLCFVLIRQSTRLECYDGFRRTHLPGGQMGKVSMEKLEDLENYLVFLAGIIWKRLERAASSIRETSGRDLSVTDILLSLEAIECSALSSGIYLRRYALTQEQKLIFSALQMDPSLVDREIAAFNRLFEVAP